MNLSPDLRQVVTVPTRRNPDAILDVIFTNIPSYFETPYTLEPLDCDENQSGTGSDHLIVVMRPLTNTNASAAKKYRIIKHRPFPDSGLREFGSWVQKQSWQEIYSTKCPTKKAVIFEEMLMGKIESIFPIKTVKLNMSTNP